MKNSAGALFPFLSQQLVNDMLTFKNKTHDIIAEQCNIAQETVLQVSQGNFSKLCEISFDNLLRFYQEEFPQMLIQSQAV